MKNIFFLLLICGFAITTFSAESSTNSAAQENRFLFVVEDSAAMSRSAKAAQQTVRELIESGVQGEMRTGDTFGIWTFDEQLNTTFPVQRWSRDASKSLALSAEDFLKKHLYKNKSPLSTALPKVYSLIKASKSITVILITTGNEAIRGTPFDKEMNTIYPQYSRELRDAKLPFVTVLIGFNGRPVAYSVNSSLGIQIPQPPLKPKIAPVKTNAAVVATNKPVQIQKTEILPTIAKVETKPEIKEPNEVAATISTNTLTPIAEPQVTPSSPLEKTNATNLPALKKDEPLKIAGGSKATESPSSIHTNKPEPTAVEQKETHLPDVAPTPVVASPMFTPKTLLIAGIALLLVATGLIFLLVSHSKKSKPSLISHSIDRKK